MAPKAVAQMANVVDLNDEGSLGAAGSVGKVVSVARRQATGARREFDEAPKCPHCGGRMHMNLPIASTNFECLWRQYNMATGGMTDPSDRFPAFTVTDIDPLNEWIKVRSRSRKLGPLTYGKMESAGGAATYAMAKAAAKSDEDVDPKAAAAAAKATKIKTGAAAATIPTKAPSKKAAVPLPTKEVPPTKSARAAVKTASTKPSLVNGKLATPVNGKAVKSKKEFDLNSMELDDDEPVATVPAKRRATPRNGTQTAPVSQGKSAVPAKAARTATPTPAKTGGKRAAALAGIK